MLEGVKAMSEAWRWWPVYVENITAAPAVVAKVEDHCGRY